MGKRHAPRDISLRNLMYDIFHETGDPVGIINDFDFASWIDHSTANNDRTGTIPFMAIELLKGVFARYYSYFGSVRSIPRHWSDLHASRIPEGKPKGSDTIPT